MTLGSVFQGALGTRNSQYYDHYPSAGELQQSHVDRGDSGGGGYVYGSIKKVKSKKSDKKAAVMSALTLLAFLFFLNILQNCLKEHTEDTKANIMMIMPTQGASQQSRLPTDEEQHFELLQNLQKSENQFPHQQQRSAKGNPDDAVEGGISRKSRNLLQYDESHNRQTKFIKNYKEIDNWTNDLSQVSDTELENQRLKTDSFKLFWKNNQLTPEEEKLKIETLPRIKINKLVKSPILSDLKDTPKIRKLKKKEKITTTTESNDIKSVEFETEESATNKAVDFDEFVINVPTTQKMVEETTTPAKETTTNSYHIKNYITQKQNIADVQTDKKKIYKNEFVGTLTTPSTYQEQNVQSNKKKIYKNEFRGTLSTPAIYQEQNVQSDKKNIYKNEFIGTLGTPTIYQEQNGILNTPRSRRSDYVSSTEDFSQKNEESSPTTVGLDLNTFQTYPVYKNPSKMYTNHRYATQVLRENYTDVVTPEPTTIKPEEIKNQNDIIQITTETPAYHPVYPTKYSSYPYDKPNRKRYPNHHGYYHTKNRYPSDVKYVYSPYRKTSPYDSGYYLRDEYYPMAVVGKYPGPNEEDVGFNLIKFVWTMFTTFARPLARLVPSFAKVGNSEPQCYDLLVCEAHRVSKYVGPTAEALASTFSTVLTWVSPDDYRQSVIDAISSGKENTCKQQIQDCDQRSGGKSAMTVIAQVMEMKMRK